MNPLDLWRMSSTMQSRNRLRTVLTVLGLAVGIGAIVAVNAIGAGGGYQIERELSRFGSGRVWITGQPGVTLTAQDAAYLESLMPGARVCELSLRSSIVSARGQSLDVELAAAGEGLPEIEELDILRGSFLRAADHTYALRSVVIDRYVESTLFGSASPLRRELVLDGETLSVVGVVEAPGLPFTKQVKGRVYIAFELYQQLYGREVPDQLMLAAPTAPDASASPDTLGERAVRLLSGGEEARYQYKTLEQEQQTARSVLRIFTSVMSGVAAICMIAGGVGVMNIMLVGVRERRREIGIQKALGAQDVHILLQFMLEALRFSMLGVMLGWTLGLLITLIAKRLIDIPVRLSLGAMVMAAGFGCAVGLVCGVIPAMEAAKMQPVLAIKGE